MFSNVLEPTARIACVYVPDFAVAVALRAIGEEPDGGLAVVANGPDGPFLVAVSRGARLDGARVGMTCAAALAVAPEVLILEQDSLDLLAVQIELERAVRGVSPALQSGHGGILYVNFAGMERRYAGMGEVGFLCDLKLAVAALELPVRTGMASTRFAARAAAILEPKSGLKELVSSPGEAHRVRLGCDREFLAPLPTSLLPEAKLERHLLERLGITALGELADLHSASLRRRLGSRGLELQHLARGREPGSWRRSAEPSRFYERLDCDCPVSGAEALLLLFRRALLAVLAALDAEGLAPGRLQWFLEMESSTRQGSVATSCRSSAATLWLRLLSRAMEQVELSGPVHAIYLEALEMGHPVHRQEQLPGPLHTSSEAVRETLEKLSTELAGRGFGQSLVHAAVWPEERQSMAGFGDKQQRAMSEPELLDASISGQLPRAFRGVQPAEPITVELRAGRPRLLRWRHCSLSIDSSFGPWEVSSGWWHGEECCRRYFQVQAPGLLAQVYSTPSQQRWFLSGWWD